MSKNFVSDNGRHYEFVRNLSRGAFGKAVQVRCQEDGKLYLFKLFPKAQESSTKEVQASIKENISRLSPITLSDKTLNDSLEHPLEMVSNIFKSDGSSGGFGYIAEYRDISSYATIYKSWNDWDKFKPDDKEACEICKRIAKIFRAIYAKGYIFKDVNENNIYFDKNNAQVYVSGCEKLSTDDQMFGCVTMYYVEPESYKTMQYMVETNLYAMAVFFYRLFVGGYPLEGKKTVRYIMDNNLCDLNPQDAKMIYQETPAFVFDEDDRSNSIEDTENEDFPESIKEQWHVQTKLWNRLPKEIKTTFQKAFKKNSMITGTEWIMVFDQIANNGVVKCKCGRHNFAGAGKCLFCNEKLN